MKEIRLHGRGGQGAVSAADMLATAALIDGKYGASFPMYGTERRGAPVVAFVSIDDHVIRQKTQIYTPDCVIVLDRKQQNSPLVFEGMKPGGILVLNAAKSLVSQPDPHISRAGVIDASTIALEELGMPAYSTCILGAFAATTGWIKLDSILSALENSFSGQLLKKNIRSVRRGYEEARTTDWPGA